jgi:hypothetical protein
MKTKSVLLSLCVVSACASTNGFGQVVGTEQLDLVVTAEQEFAQFYPNLFDPNHPKELWLTGFANNVESAANILEVTFDWINQQGQIELSPVFLVPLLPGPEPTELDVHHHIPFCPQQVSLHLAVETGEVGIAGEFRHECMVPEPGALSLAAWGGFCLLSLSRRRQLRP